MENFFLDNDINVITITATSFPEGVMAAHKKIHEVAPAATGRRFFGLSRPEKGAIIYKAAAEELHNGEAQELHCESLTIRKGQYSCITVKDFMADIPAVGKAFQTILANPNIDPQGYCVEWYINDTDIKCMVRLRD